MQSAHHDYYEAFTVRPYLMFRGVSCLDADIRRPQSDARSYPAEGYLPLPLNGIDVRTGNQFSTSNTTVNENSTHGEYIYLNLPLDVYLTLWASSQMTRQLVLPFLEARDPQVNEKGPPEVSRSN